MNWDQIEGTWKQFCGQVKEKWERLTGDELDVVAGNRDTLTGGLRPTGRPYGKEAEP
jgi:uncharacterized protein YjbJ (UPF0337 family)